MNGLENVTGIFDSHAHYDDDAFSENRSEVIESIHQNGVCGVIDIGCDLESSRFAAELAGTYSWFYASAGVHPGNAERYNEEIESRLEALFNSPKVIAVGEIGLDYHYSSENKNLQKTVFRRQMELAQRHHLPVIIHSREATADTLEILYDFPANGVVHCFSGSAETAKELIKMGYYIGFTGVITFSNAAKTKKAALKVPMNRLLLETDSPYMAPVPYRGKTCTSDLIRYTASAIAELKGISTQEVVDKARENTLRLFNLNVNF